MPLAIKLLFFFLECVVVRDEMIRLPYEFVFIIKEVVQMKRGTPIDKKISEELWK